MDVLHVSMECYPAAKTGGLADVVGSLPKYLNQAGVESAVIIPRYNLKWVNGQQYENIFSGTVRMSNWVIPFSILKTRNDSLGFPLYMVDAHHYFYREGIYYDKFGGYGDEIERYLIFQQAVLHWVKSLGTRPSVLHCHDHHTALIPFFVKYCPEYEELSYIRTVLTIHNGVYQGAFSWKSMYLLPWFYEGASGLLDWGNAINPLATGIRCCWALTTVSPGYLRELMTNSGGLEDLIRSEAGKSHGILNGIDYDVWNPETDQAVAYNLAHGNWQDFKQKNKEEITSVFRLNSEWPVVTFVGRLVREKGADLLPELIQRVLYAGIKVSFVVLGTGDRHLHGELAELRYKFPDNFHLSLEYNENLAHQLYAGSDFIIMPSRVEPCGLNQMFSMRYGTIPIVRAIGGLKDSVADLGIEGGRGIQFTYFSVEDAGNAIYRATEIYKNKAYLHDIIKRISQVDLSWNASADKYINIYHKLIN